MAGVSRPKFLVIDDNADSRFLLSKTLLRKFPGASIEECQHADVAVRIASSERPTAIVAHRTAEVDGIRLIELLRRANPGAPLVMVSGIDRTREALAAGATYFLNYDEWLRIGSVVAELLDVSDAGEAKAPG